MVGQKRRWWAAIMGNLLLLGGLVGVPFARGIWRAEAVWQSYAQAAACLLGGEPTDPPGLRKLEFVDAHFGQTVLAARARGETEKWVRRCDALIAEVAPDQAIFVWPFAKEGELRVREAAEVLRKELAKVKTPERGGERVPHDPVRALVQLRDIVEEHALSAGIIDLPVQSAVRYDSPRDELRRPTRVPIYAGANAVLTLWGDDRALEVVAVDRTGVSYLKASDGEYRSLRHVRPKLLEAFVRAENGFFLAYALPREKCRTRTGGCEGKAMGLARARVPLTELPEPRWLSAHPIDRLDRSLLAPDSASAPWWLAAETANSGTTLRGFWLTPETGGKRDSDLPPVRWSLSAHDEPGAQHLGFARSPTGTWALSASVRENSSALHATELDRDASAMVDPGRAAIKREPTQLVELPGKGAPWLASCLGSQGLGIAYGNAERLILGSLGVNASHWWSPIQADLGEGVQHPLDASEDRVLRLCDTQDAMALVLDAKGKLSLLRCVIGESACERRELVRDVQSFAALDTGKSILVASAGAAEEAQIRVQRFDRVGKPLGTIQTPSPCWSPKGGLCDQPYLRKLGSRILLAGRDQTDLLVMESSDDGLSWRTLGGFHTSP
jgi:hypothetical protein